MTGPQQSHDGYDSSNNQGHYDDQSPDYRDDYPPANTGGSGKFSFTAIVVMLVFAVVLASPLKNNKKKNRAI